MAVVAIMLLSGMVGIFGAILATVASNQFVQGYNFQSGYEALTEPVVFGGIGLLWGLLAGLACAVLLGRSGIGVRLLAAVFITVLGVAIVGGGATAKRYAALPRDPMLERRDVVLEVELRLSATRDEAEKLPSSGQLIMSKRNITTFALSGNKMRRHEGRIILPGSVPLRHAVSPRLISVDPGNGWIANFMLPLQAVPTDADTSWTDWSSAVNADAGLSETQVNQMRYRVRFGPAG